MRAERDMSAPRRHRSERDQLDLFRALPGDLAPRDAQDLMAYPFFSLAKSKRIPPIDFRAGTITNRVEAVPEHDMATIWDADVLIWAASQIVEARDAGLKTSRLMAATPYGILAFVGRGTSVLDQSYRQQAVATGMPTARWLSDPDTIAPARVGVCPSATSLYKLRRTT
jgi:plasmid replication initiation protein